MKHDRRQERRTRTSAAIDPGRAALSDRLLGRGVTTRGGTDLGHIKDCVIDTTTWTVKGLIVKLNRDVLEKLRLRKPILGTQEVFVAAEHVNGIRDRLVLNRRIEDFAQLRAEPEPLR